MNVLYWLWRRRWWWVVWLVRQLIKQRHRRVATRPIDQAFIDALPMPTHTLGGRAMEPLNLIIVGSQYQLRQVFEAAGWILADPTTPFNVLRALWAIVIDRGYPAGPVTPLVANGRIHDLAFQKPTRANRFSRRHHIRIWRYSGGATDHDCRWIVAASYDEGFKLTLKATLLTHRIAPDLDDEREFVVEELKQQGAQLVRYWEGRGPQEGLNAFGDPYHTDGRIAVLELGDER